MATTYKWSVNTTSKIDQAAKLIRIYCILNNMDPSDTSVMICAYILVYGFTERVREGIVKAGIVGTPASLKNEVYLMKKMGILEGTRSAIRVAAKIVKPGEEALTTRTLVMINLDNS